MSHDMGQSSMDIKRSMITTNNVIHVGNFTIEWRYPRNHLNYWRFEALNNHYDSKNEIKDTYTDDYSQYADFNIGSNEGCYTVVAKRILAHPKKHLITITCVGCGQPGAPTTDNLPIGWHMRCFIKSLGGNPLASSHYTKHFTDELAPSINKLFPNLSPKEFKLLHDFVTFVFYVQLHDINTKGKYIEARVKDPDHYYSGLCSFNLHILSQDMGYFKYVINLLNTMHKWLSEGRNANCITYDSYKKHVQSQTEKAKQMNQEEEKQSVSYLPNENNQTSKPTFDSNSR